jgi:hypothetical protein
MPPATSDESTSGSRPTAKVKLEAVARSSAHADLDRAQRIHHRERRRHRQRGADLGSSWMPS